MAADEGSIADTLGVVVAEVPETVPIYEAPRNVAMVADDDESRRAGPFDQGRMWTFDYPPIDYFAETYGFSPTPDWFEHARLATLRIPGCTASFVSPAGLVLTNHHCGRGHATSTNREGEHILDEGFYAESLEEERRVESMWADRLVDIRDVTPQIREAVEGAADASGRAQMHQEASEQARVRIEEEVGPGHHVEIIDLYDGALTSAYVFRRYEDVRLVMIPELKIGFFGGDPDNFTYPRYTLDVSFFRVYEEDRPLQSTHYFRFAGEPVGEGDPVFVIGNPGSTFRLSTVAELEYWRDVQEPAVLDLILTRLEALNASLEAVPAAQRDGLRNQIFSLENARKLYTGRVKALNDPVIMARRLDAQERFEAAIEADASLWEQYGDLIGQMRGIQQEKRVWADEFHSFLSMNPGASFGASVLRRALIAYAGLAHQADGEDGAGAQDGDDGDDGTGAQGEADGDDGGDREGVSAASIAGVNDQPAPLQAAFLTQRFRTFVDRFGADSPMVHQVLQGRTPEEAAQHVVEHSLLTHGEAAAEALEAGRATMDDPALQIVDAFYHRWMAYQGTMQDVSVREAELASRIGRARYAVYGTDVPPDATFSLRIADGVVAGYPYNGTVAPIHTTFYGLYDHYHAYGPDTPWDLPERWLSPPETFDLATPLNFVSTNDTIGGNSGSPVIDPDLELVGLLFDGNIESLSGDFIYLTDRSRSISVDARGILEALDEMYEADRLVLEATEGRFVETEEEADATSTP